MAKCSIISNGYWFPTPSFSHVDSILNWENSWESSIFENKWITMAFVRLGSTYSAFASIIMAVCWYELRETVFSFPKMPRLERTESKIGLLLMIVQQVLFPCLIQPECTNTSAQSLITLRLCFPTWGGWNNFVQGKQSPVFITILRWQCSSWKDGTSCILVFLETLYVNLGWSSCVLSKHFWTELLP